jgi:hypothetical protein
MMIGRHNTNGSLSSKHVARIFSEFGESVGNDPLLTPTGYVEPMFTKLGAVNIDSIDYSSYEGASVTHDMNLPIPDELKGRFSAVFDGGTLEHVFNYPQALKNAMEMVTVGGHFLAMTPCNNCMGHGFYQFSPELFFRAFSEGNGFELEDMFVCLKGHWYRVSDPEAIGQRVELINNYPTLLFIQAKRLRYTEIFATAPQQSDCVALWGASKTSPPSTAPRKSASLFLRRIVPEFVKRPIRVHRQAAHYKITNKNAFQPIDASRFRGTT